MKIIAWNVERNDINWNSAISDMTRLMGTNEPVLAFLAECASPPRQVEAKPLPVSGVVPVRYKRKRGRDDDDEPTTTGTWFKWNKSKEDDGDFGCSLATLRLEYDKTKYTNFDVGQKTINTKFYGSEAARPYILCKVCKYSLAFVHLKSGEAFLKKNIEALGTIMKDLEELGQPSLIIGDMNIDISGEVHSKNSLKAVQDLLAKFHNKWELIRTNIATRSGKKGNNSELDWGLSWNCRPTVKVIRPIDELTLFGRGLGMPRSDHSSLLYELPDL